MQHPWPEMNVAPELQTGEAHVWSVPLDAARDSWAHNLSILSSDERERAEQFRVDTARLRFVAARSALRKLLAQYTTTPPGEITFSYDANGKPHLSDPRSTSGLEFNLAHSGDLALIAFTRACKVGVDVERLRAVHHLEEIAARYFHPREAAELIRTPPGERNSAFLRCWARKEAVVKAVGTGVTRPLDFYVSLHDHGDGSWFDVPIPDSQPTIRCWLRSLVPAVDYIGAVAFRDNVRRLRCFHLA